MEHVIAALLGMSAVFAVSTAVAEEEDALAKHAKATAELAALQQRASGGAEAYKTSPYRVLMADYFARFNRNPDAEAAKNEVVVDSSWSITLPEDAAPLVARMAGHLADFFKERMDVTPAIAQRPRAEFETAIDNAIVLLDSGGGAPEVAESFTISVRRGEVRVTGRDAAGLRDGVVKLVDEIGFREAPILALGEQTYRPRLAVRVVTGGSLRDAIFLGSNGVGVATPTLYPSQAIPELAVEPNEASVSRCQEAYDEARLYALKTFDSLSVARKLPKDHPVFVAHPDMRGALTWQADGEYVLCPEHPLVKRYLAESVEGLFRTYPELNGFLIIIGGENFYHCFMRPYGVEKKHTNCARCEPLGPDTAVANLCNLLGEAARKVNPKAEVLAWPYSAVHVWSDDEAQADFIRKLKPGTAIYSCVVKDAIVEKPGGIRKLLWDYSIDMIGPSDRVKRQLEACTEAGIPLYLASLTEIGLDMGGRTAHVPCMDRWVDRADALASCGAAGAWVRTSFRPFYGSSAGEVSKFMMWEPVPDKEELLERFAARIAGKAAGPHLRKAWKHVSDAIEFTPSIPSYYHGPQYLGPAQPMCADPDAEVPPVFYGYYLFLAEMTAASGVQALPTFDTAPPAPEGYAVIYAGYYRIMRDLMQCAVDEMDKARPLVPERCRLMFDAEDSSLRWLYHTARSTDNFFQSCLLRDKLLAFAAKESKTGEETDEAQGWCDRWRAVLLDERANAVEGLPVMENDVRLDWYYGSDHTFEHGADMIRAKIKLIDHEIGDFLPALAARCGLKFSPVP
ncbi:MAG TPA: hypothetical protein HPP77_01320 [Candidatus Hydrogenedentes bacterium]|nr:hypothetical protein [Candidatus Hydrogenedentota bacterium]HIJ73199.1 hypothetical protein [Candidatus Hydrogenedentota bacterium]